MRVTRLFGEGAVCTLNNVEQNAVNKVTAICDQLAYHLRGSDLGQDMGIVVLKLAPLLTASRFAECPIEDAPHA